MNPDLKDAAAAGAATVFNLFPSLASLPPGERYQKLVLIFEASIAAVARGEPSFSDN